MQSGVAGTFDLVDVLSIVYCLYNGCTRTAQTCCSGCSRSHMKQQPWHEGARDRRGHRSGAGQQIVPQQSIAASSFTQAPHLTFQVFVADGSVYDHVADSAVASSATATIFFDANRTLPDQERSRDIVPPGVFLNHGRCSTAKC